jgi:hypothetical protein
VRPRLGAGSAAPIVPRSQDAPLEDILDGRWHAGGRQVVAEQRDVHDPEVEQLAPRGPASGAELGLALRGRSTAWTTVDAEPAGLRRGSRWDG